MESEEVSPAGNGQNLNLKRMAESPNFHGFENDNNVQPRQRGIRDALFQWVDKCIYNCKICHDFSSTKPSTFSDHVSKKHGLNMSRYIKKFGPMVPQIQKHSCMICGEEIRHDYGHIKKHARKEHNMTLISYYVAHVLDSKNRLLQDSKPSNVSRSLRKRQADIALDTPLQNKKMNIPSSGEGMLTCSATYTYSCQYDECGEALPDRESLKSHIFTVHECTVQDYFDIYGKLESVIPSIQCNFCDDSIKKLKEVFVSHLKKHNLTLNSYCLVYPDPFSISASVPAALAAKDLVEDTDDLNAEIATVKNTRDVELTDIVPSEDEGANTVDQQPSNSAISSQHQPYVADVESHTKVKLFKLVPSTQIPLCKKPTWMDRCLFICKVCEEMPLFKTRNHFVSHISRYHNLTEESYSAAHGDPVDHLEMFACRLCIKQMPYEGNFVEPHLLKDHNTTPEMYHALAGTSNK